VETTPVTDISALGCWRCWRLVTTDHISPAGSIKADSPAGKYLTEHGIERRTHSYGSRAATTRS